MILALKVDVDTYRGCREGIPKLLELFKQLDVRASFFLPHGPDNSGKAIRNLWKPSFVAKMLRTRALRLYGVRAALSGTLLPAPVLSERCLSEFRMVREAGHEGGIHGWDHRGWQDELDQWSVKRIRRELELAANSHRAIFSEEPRSFAAPGWRVTDDALRELDQMGLAYSSSTRHGPPFRPMVGQDALNFVEIPSTEPCPEEAQASGTEPIFPALDASETDCVVYPAHAEVEGGLLFDAFRDWLVHTLETTGACCQPLEQVHAAIQTGNAPLSTREISLRRIPGRPTLVASGYEESNSE